MHHRRRLMIFGLLLGSTALMGALTTPKPAIDADSINPPFPDLDQILKEKQDQEGMIADLKKQLQERTTEVREMEERLKLLDQEQRPSQGEDLFLPQINDPEFVDQEFITRPLNLQGPLYIRDQYQPLSSPYYTPQGLYLYERVVAGRGRGFESEAQALGAFFAFPVTTSGDYFFVDLAGRRLSGSGNHYGGSYGIGCRSSYFFDNEMVGLNLFYDQANILGNNLQQVGVGAELIAPNWEVYLNGYFPIGKKRVLEDSSIYTYPEDGFRILIEEEQVSMWGMDIEFGRSLVLPLDNNRNWSFYLGAGPYFYRSSHTTCCDQSLVGGQGRLNVSVGDGVNLDLFVTYDNVYKTRAMLSLTVAFPFGGVDPRPLSVRRNPIPMTKHSCKYTSLGI